MTARFSHLVDGLKEMAAAEVMEISMKIASPSSDYKEKLDQIQKLQNIPITPDVFPNAESYQKLFFSMVVGLSCPCSTVRTATLRTIRLYCIDKTCLEELFSLNGHYFITMCLERTKQASKERIQAIKFIRHCMDIDPSLFPRTFAQALVAIAKQQDDPFYQVSLEFLSILAISNLAIVQQSRGLEVLLQSVITLKPFYPSFQDSLIVVISYLITKPSRRRYMPSGGLQTIVEPFTNTYEGSREQQRARWDASQRAIVNLLRSWTGLICLRSNPKTIPSLVESLQLPDLELVNTLLGVFYKIFHLGIPSNKNPFEHSRIFDGEDVYHSTNSGHQNILDNYLAIVLVVFKEARLTENLILLIEKMNGRLTSEEGEKCKAVRLRATCLLGDLLYLSNNLLPPSLCADLQALPTLVNNSIKFEEDPRLRSLSSTTVSNLEKYAMLKRSHEQDQGSKLDYFGEIKKKLDLTMDETLFRQKLNETAVLVKKDFNLWRWDIIRELVEGPLYHPPYFENPNSQKVLTKVLSFLLPNNKAFLTIPYNSENKQIYASTSLQLLKLVLTFPSGTQMLMTHKLIPQIRDLLNDEIKNNGSKDSLLSRDRLLRSMTLEYFTFLGLLSGSPAGREVLEKHRVFDVLLPLSILESRDDLSNVVIKNLEYNSPNCTSRMLLANALKAKSLVVRFVVMRQIGVLFKKRLSDFSQWCIVLLVQQLGDSNSKIANTALSVLHECAEDPECLESIIARKPYELLNALDSGHTLLVRLLSSPNGFKYLSTTPFIEEQLKYWKDDGGYISYVTQIDHALNTAFSAPVWKLKEGQSDTEVEPPSHFYGQLACTTEGIKLLADRGVFQWLKDTLTSSDTTDLQKRGALWALGNIGSSRLAFKQLIAKEDVFGLIIQLAKCPSLPIRGTCFYVLGMLAKLRAGSKSLISAGWDSVKELGIALPIDTSFLTVETSQSAPEWPEILNSNEINSGISALGDKATEALNHFIVLSNSIKADKSVAALKQMKTTFPEVFEDTKLQFMVFKLLECYSYRLPPRRFCYQIFSTHWKSKDIENLPQCKIVPAVPLTEENFCAKMESAPLRLKADSRREKSSRRRASAAPRKREK